MGWQGRLTVDCEPLGHILPFWQDDGETEIPRAERCLCVSARAGCGMAESVRVRLQGL